MSPSEFKKWLAVFGGSFPDVSQWLVNAGQEAVQAWERSIIDLEYQDAEDAIQSILDGKESMPKPWSMFPSTIRTIANSLFSNRQKQNSVMNRKPELPVRGRHNTGDMFRFVMECMTTGMTKQEALLVLNKKFPISDADQRRYSCLRCQDTGHVLIWHERSVMSVLSDEIPFKNYTSLVLCTCRAGQRLHTDRGGAFHQPPNMATFDHERMAEYGDGNREELRQWVTKWRCTQVERMPNYEPGFA